MITIVIGICAFISGVILGAGVGTYRMGEKVKRGAIEVDGKIYVTRSLSFAERERGEVQKCNVMPGLISP